MSRATAVLIGSEAEAFIEIQSHSKKRPLWFFRNILGVTPRTWQRNLLLRIQEKLLAGVKHIEVHCRCAHGSGKTFVAAGIVPWFTGTRENARTLTTAPTWRQVEGVLWPEITALYNGSVWRRIGYGRMLTHELSFGDKWYATGAASDRPENLEGHHGPATCRVIDEAKAVDDGVYVATSAMLNGPESLDVWISTPSIQSGQFFRRDVDSGDELIRVVVTVEDLINDPLIPQPDRDAYAAWRDKCAKEWGVDSAEFRSRCMAEYADNAEGALFPMSWIEAAFRRELTPAELDGLTRIKAVAGMDVAGSVDGDETAVATVKDSDAMLVGESLTSWKERDTMLSKGRAMAQARESNATLRIDSIGIGQGVYNAASESGADVQEYRASEKAHDPERFINRKAEDAWVLRQRLEKGQVSLAKITGDMRRKLTAQMAAMKYEITSAGKLKVVDPSDSPDCADALLIASASPRIGIASVDVDWL